ncbi:leucyl aminopeptidase [Aestuariivirga litoralis]|uniref:leucyl aminopeptidase n=1 Tax=Aestuariivirga litoralis TaxID=2650924 RepID=UPI0018C799F9|nr:leucyl aminopeptidase [Aestuariivirga litoralis]MBG1232026.1 leucyl aminopeptidase [Aestuariivirga litoralis]
MKITFVSKLPQQVRILCIVISEGAPLPPAGKALNDASQGRISQAVKVAKFTGKRDQTLEILAPSKSCDRLFLFGAGEAAKVTARELELTGGALAGALGAAKVESAGVVLNLPGLKLVKADEAAALVASGASLRNYQFLQYKSKKPENGKRLESLVIEAATPAKAKAAFANYEALAEGVHLARDLVNEPANVLYPAEFANRAKALSKSGVKVEILNPAQMKKLGMGALLGVSQGSPFEPRLVVMRWDGGKAGEAPVAFIGKGVTFDTGGVSIKPAGGMEDMKGDMGGAACVTGLMLALAKRKAKANVIGAIGIVENAIDGAAQRPGDVVKSMSGQTIAVLNTDAEGRLILADVLWYVQDRFKPKFMVNLATLTGAIMGALGKDYAGLFSNNDELSTRLTEAGLETGERVWRMPMGPEYDKLIDSDIADMKNIGGRFGGAITAAQFLQRFVNKVPWAHLDVAGTAMDSTKTAINQSWGSGWGVRLLNRLVADHYES